MTDLTEQQKRCIGKEFDKHAVVNIRGCDVKSVLKGLSKEDPVRKLLETLDKLTVICYAANGDVILMLDPKDVMVFLKDKVLVDRKQLEDVQQETEMWREIATKKGLELEELKQKLQQILDDMKLMQVQAALRTFIEKEILGDV